MASHEDQSMHESLLGEILRATADGILAVDRENKVLFTNESFSVLWGIPPALLARRDDEALLAFALDQLIDPQGFVAKVRELYASTEESFDTLQFKDGRVVERVSRPLMWGGVLRGRIWSFRDVTMRRRAEDALRESEERWRSIVDCEPECVKLLDREGRVVEMNPAGLAMVQATLDQVRGNPAVGLVAESDRAAFTDMVAAVFRGESRHLVFDMIGLAGRRLTLESTSVPLRDSGSPGGVKAMLGVTRDITESRRSEEALRASEGRFRGIAEHIADSIIEADRSGRITYINRLQPGLTIEQVLSATVFDFVPVEQRPIVGRALEAVFDRAETSRYESEGPGPNGESRTYEVSVSPSFAGDRIISAVFLARDITDRKRTEAENVRLQAETLQLQKTESLSRMAGAIAHHFNNRLQVVTQSLELAQAELAGGAAPSADWLGDAMRAARGASEVSGLMLTYLGQIQAAKERLDLSAVCRQSLPMFYAALPRGVALETDLPFPGPAVNGSASQIQQVLTNLVTNAWEALQSPNGTVRLRVRSAGAREIPARHRFPLDWQPRRETYACLEVADTGCGIALENLGDLFDPYYSTKFVGRGLGLSVVLGIVRSHDGVITVESEPGSGSVFGVYLPLETLDVRRTTDASADAPADQKGGTVLLVEDEEMVRKIAAAMLRKLGYTVLAAADGVDAVDLFRQHAGSVRFVLCDLTMPRMDGWETLGALRAISPGLPVILVSGFNVEQVMGGRHTERPQACLTKPYGREQLQAAIREALGAAGRLD